MQALEHHNGQSTGSASEASCCSVLKMDVDTTKTSTVNIQTTTVETVETVEAINNIEIIAEVSQPNRIGAERITATGGRIPTCTDSNKEGEDSSRPATGTSITTTTAIIDTTSTTPNTGEGVDTAGVHDGDPGNISGSTSTSAPANTCSSTSTSSGTGTDSGTAENTTREPSLRSSLALDSSLPLHSPLSPFAFAFGSAFGSASATDSSDSPHPPPTSTTTSTFPSSSFTLAKAPPPKKYARLPPPIQIGGKLRNSTAFLLSPSPPQSALLSPSSGTLFSSPSTSADSPSSSLFTSAASAPETRASSSSSRTLTTTANAGLHNDNHSDSIDNDGNTSTFFHGPSDSITSPTSPVLTAWPDQIDVSNDTAEPPKNNIRPPHSRSLSAGHSSITMTVATATRNAAASDNFLRASFKAGHAHNNSQNNIQNNNSRWRPTSAKSARSADRSRRRSPSPLFNPFARVSRHQHNDTEDNNMRASTSNGRWPSYSRRGSLSSGAAPPPLTREEFEALPVAIQRKYFSTLERLRFAQGSGNIDGIYQHYDAISAQNIQRRRARQDRIASDNITTRLRKRSLRLESSSLLSHHNNNNNGPSPAIGDAVADTLFYANLPDKIKKREFTREEQVKLAGQLHASVILDAADEAIYKIGRRASITHRLIAPDITVDTPTTTSFRHSMETIHSSSDPRLGLGHNRDALGLEDATAKRISGVPESFYDSFRWLEEDDDLDLSLNMDEYHSNLRDALPSPNKERGPSFRRHLSISKMSFSRPLPQSPSAGSVNNNNNSRPATKDDVASTRTARSPSITGNGMTTPFPSMPSSTFSSPTGAGSHLRRKSRTLSLITPKQHAVHDSISSIDPGAAHYQDPEARLKLRVYLASPQKFDEAIEFGFPSTEVLSSMSVTGGSPPMGSSSVLSSTNTKGNRVSTATTAVEKRRTRRATRQSASDGTMRTFLADDDDDDENDGVPADADMTKLDSDQASVPDPESPKTPILVDSVGTGNRKTSSSAFRPYRISTSTDSAQQQGGHRPSDSYAQVPASSREMTLRMTLTRLDLRAGEDQIYGWQQKKQYHVHHQSSSQNLMQSSSNHIRKSSTATGLGAVGPHYPPPRKDSLLLPSSTTKTTTTTTTTTTTSTSTCDSTVTYLGAGAVSRPKASIEDVFAGIDHWEADQDKGVMKRFWNRVRRS